MALLPSESMKLTLALRSTLDLPCYKEGRKGSTRYEFIRLSSTPLSGPTMSILTILALLAAALVHALPATNVSAPLPGRADLEWTAWGDSYASGVGSGKYTGGRRCLRYDSAYPVDVSKDSSVGGRLNNVVCSGAKADEVNEYQFYTSSTWVGHPNWQFYPRPSSGKPSVGTLSVGGDDIDFPGILSNCILEGFP